MLHFLIKKYTKTIEKTKFKEKGFLITAVYIIYCQATMAKAII